MGLPVSMGFGLPLPAFGLPLFWATFVPLFDFSCLLPDEPLPCCCRRCSRRSWRDRPLPPDFCPDCGCDDDWPLLEEEPPLDEDESLLDEDEEESLCDESLFCG